MSGMNEVEVVLATIRAVEARDRVQLGRLYHPEVEFHWPPGLPYGGRYSGSGLLEMNTRYAGTWDALQPDEQTRRMNPIVLATGERGRVVVRYALRGKAASGETFEADTLAEYQVRDGHFASARMYHFDLRGLIDFIQRNTLSTPDVPQPI